MFVKEKKQRYKKQVNGYGDNLIALSERTIARYSTCVFAETAGGSYIQASCIAD